MSTPQTSRRVSVTLTLATTNTPTTVLDGLLEQLGDLRQLITDTHVGAYDLDDQQDPAPAVQLVIYDPGGLAATYVDQHDRAHAHARNIGAVVVELPVGSDYRAKEVRA
jgi:hypothetical protein